MALANSQDNFQDIQLPFLSEMALDFTKTVCLNKVETLTTFACMISVISFRQMEEHFLLLLNTILNQELDICK